MGRYKNGINGSFYGKVGAVVGSSWRGIDYMRSLPDIRTKAFSRKQCNQHFLMGMVSSWLKPLKGLIETGYQVFVTGKTPMNGCISYHMKHAVTGNSPEEYLIDFSKVILSRGELLIALVKEATVLANAVLHIKWDNAASSLFNNDDDEAVFVVYNPAKTSFVCFNEAIKRADKAAILQLPADYAGDTVHCWQHFVNAAGHMVSTTVYIGKVQL